MRINYTQSIQKPHGLYMGNKSTILLALHHHR